MQTHPVGLVLMGAALMGVCVQGPSLAAGLVLCSLELHVIARQCWHQPITGRDILQESGLTWPWKACGESMLQLSTPIPQPSACSSLHSALMELLMCHASRAQICPEPSIDLLLLMP